MSSIAKKKQMMTKHLREWCEKTTVHGFSHLVEPTSMFRKFVWVIIIAGFSIYCLIGKSMFLNIFSDLQSGKSS